MNLFLQFVELWGCVVKKKKYHALLFVKFVSYMTVFNTRCARDTLKQGLIRPPFTKFESFLNPENLCSACISKEVLHFFTFK